MLCVPEAWSLPIAGFLAAQLAAGLPTSTMYTRRQHLEHLARRIGEGTPWDVTGQQLVAWCGMQTWARETRRGRRSTFRAFWSWAVDAELTTTNPALSLPAVRPSPPMPHPTPDDVTAAALRRADDRERLMIRLASECGMRRAEIAQCHTDDLFQAPGGWSLTVHGKGGKRRNVPLAPGLAAVLRMEPWGYLFPGDDEGHLSPRWLGNRVNRLLDGDWTIHSLRHRFAARAHAVNRDLATVQDLLGHASPATTRIYVPVDDSELRRTVEAIAL